ncbi:GNAT family N-acetyltransferase [Sphingosinicella sp. LHD-64]|uniref:GNAT family N-acetyltransferase n=1 Tax=Sphingosinicella sp. LHD-64 TaxID=3072139 RepID=UPI00280CD35B|nr:GNAT family N-acetyltransferase [Sphingosinicella sp. LHD-64]MDQ8754609.1 GNAT family N-acetyltransferase [Sphingosinicella sp. LHD-64]
MHPAGQIATPTDRAGTAPVRLDAAPDGLGARVRDTIDPELAAEWMALAADAAEPNAFAEPWFVAASLAAFGATRDVRLIEVRSGNALIGMMPVAIEHRYGRMPVRFLQNWCHHQMFLGTPLVRAGQGRAFWTAVFELLDGADWATGFFHLRGVVEEGPVHRALLDVRPGTIVHRETRAFLESDLSPDAYYKQAVRPKKRKEIRRLQNRLGELGKVRVRRLEEGADLHAWADAFLALEKAGWKGQAGSALASTPETESFFFTALAGAWEAGRLQFLRLDLDDRPIAMLVNFLTPPGSFSFKTAFDEAYARFSPGVLIQLENLDILDRPDIAWMDSCAVEDHPMIDSLWTGRRHMVRVTVRLAGARRSATYAAARTAEIGWTALRCLMGKAR